MFILNIPVVWGQVEEKQISFSNGHLGSFGITWDHLCQFSAQRISTVIILRNGLLQRSSSASSNDPVFSLMPSGIVMCHLYFCDYRVRLRCFFNPIVFFSHCNLCRQPRCSVAQTSIAAVWGKRATTGRKIQDETAQSCDVP